MTRFTLLLIVSLITAPVSAQTFVWNLPGTGSWNSASSWNPNTGTPTTSATEAFFGNAITTTASVTLASPVSVNLITFDGITGTKAYTIGNASNAITFAGTNAGLTVNANVTSTGEQTFLSSFEGVGNITVNGGNLLFSNDISTFTGAINVNAGRLRFQPSNQTDRPLGDALNIVTVASGGQLFCDAEGFNEMPYSLTIAGNGFAGVPALQTGALRFGGASPSRWTGLITLSADASIRFSGSASIRGGVNIGVRTLTFLGAVNEVGLVEVAPITGSGNVVYDSASTTVNVNSTYTGTTNLISGFTFITVPDALGQSLGTIANKATVQLGAKLYLNGFSPLSIVNKLLTLNGGELVGNTGAKSWAGAIDLTAPSLIGAEGIAGVLTITGGISNAGNLLTLRVNFSDSVININTIGINGGGGMAVISPTTPGAVNLNVTSTYTGPTTVTSGRLFANATQSTGTNTVTVSDTGVLRGTGSIINTININSGGTLFPGSIATPGTLTANSNVNFVSGATFQTRVKSSSVLDVLRVTSGTVTLTGATLSVDSTGYTVAPGDLTIINASGATVTGTFLSYPNGATLTTTSGNSFFVLYDTTGPNQRVYLSPVPEPASVLALAALGLLGVRIRRSRKVL